MKQPLKMPLIFLGALFISLTLAGQVSTHPPPRPPKHRPPGKPPVYKHRYAPKPVRARPPRPAAGYIWVPRYEHPAGVYVDGFWRPPKKKGFVWVEGHWKGDVWVPGHWNPETAKSGHIWVPGYWDGGSWIDGYWRPSNKPGYIWVPGHYNKQGKWIKGHWKNL